jgi:glycosyltransferase involved in cell wall biosynthesis
MKPNSSVHLMVISSVRPEPTSGGQIILFRHLSQLPEQWTWEVHGTEPTCLTWRTALRRLGGKLGTISWGKMLAESFWVLWKGRWLDEWLPPPPANKRTVVLTVAHGDACHAAARYARKHRLPLVTFFHDWWPDFPPLLPFLRPVLERQMRDLARVSSICLCCSPAMRDFLGPHRASHVLYPIPAQQRLLPITPSAPTGQDAAFRVVYFGNLQEYGPMVGKLLHQLKDHPFLRLQVRGSNPSWPASWREEFSTRGLWLPFQPLNELEGWLQTADAFLVTQSFDPALARRMTTSFPTKLCECAAYAKPLIVWGPSYGSAALWAGNNDKALVVSSPNPRELVTALEHLARQPEEQRRLSLAAARAYASEFNPQKLQELFLSAIERALSAPVSF